MGKRPPSGQQGANETEATTQSGVNRRGFLKTTTALTAGVAIYSAPRIAIAAPTRLLSPVSPPEAFGSEFAFRLNPAELSFISISVTETLPSATPSGLFVQQAMVPVVMNVDITLTYLSLTGTRVLAQMVQVDNDIQEMRIGGSPVNTLIDIFGPITDAVSTVAEMLVTSFTAPLRILLAGAAAFVVAKEKQYHTDKGANNANIVKMLKRGGYLSQTVGQECTALANFKINNVAVFTAPQIVALKAKRKGVDGKVDGDTTDTYDCHGKTFAMSQSWINDCEVQKILDGNGYAIVTPPNIAVGDVCIFRDPANLNNKAKGIVHSETVTAVNAAGVPTRSCGKWGATGEYEHDVAVHPYGAVNIEYRHSARANGHKLKKAAIC